MDMYFFLCHLSSSVCECVCACMHMCVCAYVCVCMESEQDVLYDGDHTLATFKRFFRNSHSLS